MLKLFFVIFSVSVIFQSAFARNYEIVFSSFSERSVSACSSLKTVRTIQAREKEPNLSAQDRKNLEVAREMMREVDVNLELRRTAATVAISVNLPAILSLNMDKFFVEGVDGSQIGTFASDLLEQADVENRVVLTGNGRTTYRIELTAAAFCERFIRDGAIQSVQNVLDDLIY